MAEFLRLLRGSLLDLSPITAALNPGEAYRRGESAARLRAALAALTGPQPTIDARLAKARTKRRSTTTPKETR